MVDGQWNLYPQQLPPLFSWFGGINSQIVGRPPSVFLVLLVKKFWKLCLGFIYVHFWWYNDPLHAFTLRVCYLGIWHFLFQLSLCKSIAIQVRNNFAYTCRRKVIFLQPVFCKLAALELIRNMENSMLCMQNFVMQKSVQKQEFAWLLMMLVESPHDTDKFLQWEWSFALFKICAKNASAIFSLPSTELLHYRNLHFPQQNSLL